MTDRLLEHRLLETLDRVAAQRGPVVALTGAGISAESGIPTFRGPEGYWRVGSRNFRAEELATRAAFFEMPEEVWAWYLYRRGVCCGAEPNAAHLALVALERAAGDRFTLITQNVDGLHQRAGHRAEKVLAIHGNIHLMRCSAECGAATIPVPEQIPLSFGKDTKLGPVECALLRCHACGVWMRPHILWFDESYDEERYFLDSALSAADQAELLLVVGTSGATSLPSHIVARVARRGAALVVVNQDPSPFSAIAEGMERGFFVMALATRALPPIVDRLL